MKKQTAYFVYDCQICKSEQVDQLFATLNNCCYTKIIMPERQLANLLMSVMPLSDQKNPQLPVLEEKYIGLIVNSKQVQSFLITNQGLGPRQLIAKSEIHLVQDLKSLAITIDQSLQELGPDSEQVGQVVLILDPDWWGEQVLKEEYRLLLIKTMDELGLEVLLVVSANQLWQQLWLEQNESFGGVLLFLSQSQLNLSLLLKREIAVSLTVGNSGNPQADLHEALARLIKLSEFDHQSLPATIQLCSLSYSRLELIEVVQSLLDYSWHETYPFVRVVKIETCDMKWLAEKMPALLTSTLHSVAGLNQLTTPQNHLQLSSLSVSQSDNLKTASTLPSKTLVKSFGVPLSKQVLTNITNLTNDINTLAETDQTIDSNFTTVNLPDFKEANDLSLANKHRLSNFSRLVSIVTCVHWQRLAIWARRKVLTFLLAGIILGLLFTGSFLYWWVVSRSIIIFTIKPQILTLQKDVEITLDPSVKSSNVDKLVLKAEMLEHTFSAKDRWESSGIKLVGEKARGRVNIFNKTDSEKKLAANTVFTAEVDGKKIRFVNPEEVTIPPSSTKEIGSGTGSTTEYGKKEIVLIATNIGSEFNINKDTSLIIADFSTNSYSAITLENFSGGSSREVRAISEKDQADLFDLVSKDIINQAEEYFSQISINGQYFVPTGELSFTKQEFSAKVGDEIDQFSLTVEARAFAIGYSLADLKPFAMELLQNQLPSNYQFDDQDLELLATSISQGEPVSNSSASAKNKKLVTRKILANFTIKAHPNLEETQLIQSLLNQKIYLATQQLKDNSSIAQVSVDVSWSVASRLLSVVPADPKRVRLRIVKD